MFMNLMGGRQSTAAVCQGFAVRVQPATDGKLAASVAGQQLCPLWVQHDRGTQCGHGDPPVDFCSAVLQHT
jgi:hypothetical protein